jgi:phosphatidylglycerol lysyltransferase
VSPRSARLRTGLTLVAVLVVAGVVAAALHSALRGISLAAVVESLRVLPLGAITLSLAATALSFPVLLGNDIAALRYAGAAPPRRAIALASFCGYALGNAIGFGGLSGGAVRFRLYGAAGVPAGKIARVTLFIGVAFGVGVSQTIALGLLFRAEPIAALSGLPVPVLHGLAALVIAAFLGLLAVCAVRPVTVRIGPVAIETPGPRLLLAQLLVTMADMTLAATALWVLLPPTAIDFPGFAAIYVVALGLGVLSHAPGGLGVFDATLLFAVGAGSSANAVAAALLAYRLIYFGLPFALAATLMSCHEIRRSLSRV